MDRRRFMRTAAAGSIAGAALQAEGAWAASAITQDAARVGDGRTVYVSMTATAADTNDGLSPGSAKATLAAAIAAITPLGGGVIQIGTGTFDLGGAGVAIPVINSGALIIQGAGVGLTRFSYSGPGWAFTMGDGGALDARRTYLQDLSIFGTASAAGGVRMHGSRFCGLRRVEILDFPNAAACGLLITGGVANYFNEIDNCRFRNVPVGVRLDGGAGIGANSNYISHCHFGVHSSCGVQVDGGDSNIIADNEFNGSTATGIYLHNNAVGNKIVGNQFDGPKTAVNCASPSVHDTRIFNNTGVVAITDVGTGTFFIGPSSTYGRDGMTVGGENGRPTATPLRVKAAPGQTANAFDVVNSASTVLFKVDPAGNVEAPGSLTTHARAVFNNDVGRNGNVVTITTSTSPTATGLRVSGAVGQSADLIELRDGRGAFLGGMSASGRLRAQSADPPPQNRNLPVAWLNVIVAGTLYKMPLHR